MGAPPGKSFPSLTDSLRRSFWAIAIAFGLVLVFALFRPGQAYPLQGLWVAGSLALLLAGAGLVAVQARLDFRGLNLAAAPLVLFAAWTWLRTAFSSVPTEGAFSVGTLCLGVAAFYLSAFLARGIHSFRPAGSPVLGAQFAADFFAALGILFSLHGILEYHWIYPRRFEMLSAAGYLDPADPINEGILYALKRHRVGSVFGNPNVFCGFLAMTLPLLVAVVGEAQSRARALWGGAFVLGIPAIFYAAARTESAGGGLVLLAGAAASFFLPASRKWAIRAYLLAGIALWFLVFTGMGIGKAEPASEPATARAATVAKDSDEAAPRPIRTIAQRIYYLRSGLEMFSEAPLLGHGAGAYARLYPRTRIFGAGETRYAHNFVMQIVVETGLLGLALFLGLIAALGRSVFAAVRAGGMSASGWAIGAALILFLLHSLGDYTFYVRETYLDFCALAGVFVAAAPRKRPQAPPDSRRWIGLLLPAAALVLILGALARVIVPAQMAHFYRQRVEDVWKSPERDRNMNSQALQWASRAVAWKPSDPWLYQLRAHAYGQTGRTAAMRSDLEKAMSLHPDSSSLRADLAAFEWNHGNRERALALMKEAIDLYPLRSGLREQRARYLAATGQREEALAEAREAVRLAFTNRERISSQATLAELE